MFNFIQNHNYRYMSNFTPSEILQSLKLQPTNPGTSTGTSWMGTDKWITSFSPIDGKELGKVSVTSKSQGEKRLLLKFAKVRAWPILYGKSFNAPYDM